MSERAFSMIVVYMWVIWLVGYVVFDVLLDWGETAVALERMLILLSGIFAGRYLCGREHA